MTLGYMSGPLLIAWLGSAPEMMALPGAMFAIAGALVLFNARKLPDLPLPSSPLLAHPALFYAASGGGGVCFRHRRRGAARSRGRVGLRSGWSEGQIVAAIFAFALGGACGSSPPVGLPTSSGPSACSSLLPLPAPSSRSYCSPKGGRGPWPSSSSFSGAPPLSRSTRSRSRCWGGRRGGKILPAPRLYIVCFSAGVAIGPPTVGLGVEQLGPDFFLLALAAVPLVFPCRVAPCWASGQAC